VNKKSANIICLIPARSGSVRIPDKNIKKLGEHPLLAYTITSALRSQIFSSVIVSTDSAEYAEIARYYGAEVPFLRPKDLAGEKSPDFEWVKFTLEKLREMGRKFEFFSILRPTSPFRKPETIQRAWETFQEAKGADSIRAVEKCKQHPGKMWRIEGDRMKPLLTSPAKGTPWHSCQYASLPEIFVQNASLEIARAKVVFDGGTISGSEVTPFFTRGNEGFDINRPEDWWLAEHLLSTGQEKLIEPEKPAMEKSHANTLTELYYIPYEELLRLRELSVSLHEKASLFATACRINTLYMIKKAGSGHIGTSFSSMDILCWLHMAEMKEDSVFFSSKGHDVPAIYSVLLALGKLPFEKIHQLRRLGGLPGHPDIHTPHIKSNTGSLGMGISKAKGIAFANRLKGEKKNIYVLLGDGELQEGQVWESLASAANKKLGEITVIVDFNEIQSDTWVKNVSDLGDIEAKFRSFGWEVRTCDGHSSKALEKALQSLKSTSDRPKAIIAHTKKGGGVSFMEASSPVAMAPEDGLYKFHSGAPDDENYLRAYKELRAKMDETFKRLKLSPNMELESVSYSSDTPSSKKKESLIRAYASELVKQGEKNPKLVVLDADLVKDCGLLPFRERFPDRFFECGIAEQDMVSQAGAMARENFLPIVHSFACFLSSRPNEQIYNNATEDSKIIYVGSLAGLIPSGPGHSHQAVRDLSSVGAVPSLIAVEPSCETEVGLTLDYCVKADSSFYLRLTSVPIEIPYSLPKNYKMSLGKGVFLREGKDALLIAYGPAMLREAYLCAEQLKKQNGNDLAVMNLPWLNRVDPEFLRTLTESYGNIFTIDNHYLIGGQGQYLAATAAGFSDLKCRFHSLGLSTVPFCGTNAEVLAAHGLDAEHLAKFVTKTLGQTVGQRFRKAS
jgi:transketolase